MHFAFSLQKTDNCFRYIFRMIRVFTLWLLRVFAFYSIETLAISAYYGRRQHPGGMEPAILDEWCMFQEYFWVPMAIASDFGLWYSIESIRTLWYVEEFT